MDTRPTEPQAESITELIEQVERALKDGSADSYHASQQKVRQDMVDALIKAEQIDPKKLIRIINI